ncbi:MAG: hypothetical protein A4E51_01514 [Methanosaeta sp. PtaU1.Bin055]|nr:MAG: hypothetical protein A4E51_01514 [Methanosaeta sp. PtaU1.Bin055]
MEYSEGRLARIFFIRLEEGEDLLGSITRFLVEKGVESGFVHFLGALRKGRLIMGPREATVPPGPPFFEDLDGGWEIFGLATFHPGEGGEPSIHIHASAGRAGRGLTGCLREEATAYLVVEAVVFEVVGFQARRSIDERTGLTLPQLDEWM